MDGRPPNLYHNLPLPSWLPGFYIDSNLCCLVTEAQVCEWVVCDIATCRCPTVLCQNDPHVSVILYISSTSTPTEVIFGLLHPRLPTTLWTQTHLGYCAFTIMDP